MRTILVPVGGGDSDAIVINTAFAIASPLRAHLDFLHVRVTADEAARHTPHIEFARGPALHSAFVELERVSVIRSTQANRHVVEFCGKVGIGLNAAPHRPDEITAGWREEEGEGFERILFHARHHDLAVMARHKKSDGLAPDRLNRLLLEAGLMVMGGYGHSPVREMLFGGCTEAILDNADISVFIAH